jgi:HK97 family phage prohead protease
MPLQQLKTDESQKDEKALTVPDREYRFCAAEFRIADPKAGTSDLPVLDGYAAVFNKVAEIWPGYREKIAHGAFTRTLAEGADVRALVDHDPSRILGRNTAGTLTLEENNKGLKVRIAPANTTAGRDIVESVRRGDVTQMSFAFLPIVEEFEEHKDGSYTRTLKDVDLFDVSIVTYPAYPQTSIAVRSLERWKEQRAEIEESRARAAASQREWEAQLLELERIRI